MFYACTECKEITLFFVLYVSSPPPHVLPSPGCRHYCAGVGENVDVSTVGAALGDAAFFTVFT